MGVSFGGHSSLVDGLQCCVEGWGRQGMCLSAPNLYPSVRCSPGVGVGLTCSQGLQLNPWDTISPH